MDLDPGDRDLCHRDRCSSDLADPTVCSANSAEPRYLVSFSPVVTDLHTRRVCRAANVGILYLVKFTALVRKGSIDLADPDRLTIYMACASEPFRMDVQSDRECLVWLRIGSRFCRRQRYGP